MLVTLPLLAALCGAPLTLDAALDRAAVQSPRLQDLQAQIAAGEAQTGATRANYGPKLRVEANVMVWDSTQELNLAGGGAAPQLPPPQQPYDFVVAALLDKLSQPTTVRDQVTASATVQVVQPLVGLYGVSQSAELSSLGVDVTRLQVESARRRVSLDVIEAWYRVWQAEALRGAAEKTAASLDAQATRIGQLEANGFVARNEVLRVQAALSAARQRVVEADAAAAQARAALSVAMGEVPGTAYDLAPAAPVWAEATPASLESVREHALSQRPEVTEVEMRIAQAEQGVSVARARLLPDLNLLGQYQHTEGSKFQAADAFSAGAVLSWTAFEWGATAQQIDVAETQVTRTRAALAQIRAGVALEVEGAWRSHDAAVKALSVAEAGVAQADEALRLTRARFEVQQATTSDVLDAEAALLQARVNLENARYGRVTALARLRFAEGAK
jgi:outer membrane protein